MNYYSSYLKDRLNYARYFYQHTSKPFLVIKTQVENGEEPYSPINLPEDPEPLYLEDWSDAQIGLELVGSTVFSLLSSSVQLFLNDWILQFEKTNTKFKRTHKKGWFHAYKIIIEELGYKIDECPADFGLMEQAFLARNRGQHPDHLTIMSLKHSDCDLTKYPIPFFISQYDENIIDRGLSNPSIYIDKNKLDEVINEIEKLSDWLVQITDEVRN